MSKRKWSESATSNPDVGLISTTNPAYPKHGAVRPQLLHASSSGVINSHGPSSVPAMRSDTAAYQPMQPPTPVNGNGDITSWQEQPTKSAVVAAAEALPNITRKITACAACRKQKIKCNMPDDLPPCTRCARRNLQCVLNKSLQSLLEDKKQTELVQSDIRNLHETLSAVCRQLNIDAPKSLRFLSGIIPTDSGNGTSSDNDRDDKECEVSPPSSPSAVQAPIDTFLEIAKLGSPGSADTPHSLRHKRPATQQDLISKGIITLAVAESLLERYFTRLDHYLYGIASTYKDIQSVRQASPVLLAAICTVSALHDPKDQSVYEACNREFRRLVSRSVFEKRDVEYLRALCIASFWLSDASRIFSSDAIRRAADIHLHRHFRMVITQVTDGSPRTSLDSQPQESADRVRLWYLLFVSDQHLSILHNRDALLRSDKEIATNWEAFLYREDAMDSDVRIMSQVSLLLIMSQVRDTLGAEHEQQLPRMLATHINNYARQLDKWFNKFSALFKPNPQIGEFPRKGLQMHYQFGKLHLGHHVFNVRGEPIPSYFLTAASMAHDAAITIFEMILHDIELQESLVGMPHYFHIMIAFAGTFLLEVCNKYHDQLSINLDSDLGLVNDVLLLFNNISCIPQHPIFRMTTGLGRKLFDTAASTNKQWKFGGFPIGVQPTQRPAPFSAAVPPSLSTAVQHNPEHFATNLGDMTPGMADLAFADFGEFNFPDISLNFMS